MQITKNQRCNFRCLVINEGIYHIFEEDLVNGHWRIFKRVYSGGVLSDRMGPLFELGDMLAFDEYGQADPTVIIDGQWKMWFDAMDRTYHWDRIGYATSPDGVHWAIQGIAIERGAPGEWDEKSVHHPVVIKADKYYMFYSGCKEGEMHNVRHIGLATSCDGLEWDKQGIVIEAGWPDEWDGEYVRPSNPIRLLGEWVMFYWGFNRVHSMGIATSKDLVHWQKRGTLLEGTDSHDGVTASFAISDGNKVTIYYTTFDNCELHKAEYIV